MAEEFEKVAYPLAEKVKLGTGAFAVAEVAGLFGHMTGLPLVAAGGLAAFVAYREGPGILAGIKAAIPAELLERRERTGRSFLDRFIGRYPQIENNTAPSLAEGSVVDLAHNVQIYLNDVVGKAIFVCGIRRHGKTTLGARLAEQLGKYHIPLFIPDFEGDYLSLADVLPRAVIAGPASADAQYQSYEFAALDKAEEALELGYNILDQGYQVILDMSAYDSIELAAAMQINIIRGMFKWAKLHPDQRTPSHVFLDEAQRYLPQTLSDSVITDKSVVDALLKCYMDIIAIGGKRGIAPVILTQRFAQVNKKIMAQSEVFFLLRQTNDGDLDRCMEYVSSDIATEAEISKFKPGEGVYISTTGEQCVTTFKQRASSGSRSTTPHADAAKRYASMPLRIPTTKVLAPPALPAETKVLAPSLQDDSEAAGEESDLTLEEKEAWQCYCKGLRSGRKIAAALQVSDHKGTMLLNQLIAKGYVEAK